MKKQITILLCASVLFMCWSALAQTDKEAIEKRLNKSFQALPKQDWQTIETLCTDDWVHLNHMGMRWSMAEMKKFFSDHITDHTIEVSNIDVRVSADGAMACATFDEKTSYKFDGNPVSESAVFTAVFVKEDNAWKMAVLQRTLVQPPPETSEK